MTFDERVAKCFNEINDSYSALITPEAYGLYHQLIWLKHDVFHGEAITYEYITQYTGLNEGSIFRIVTLLEQLNLVELLKRKKAIKILFPTEIGSDDQVKLLENLVGRGIIDLSERQRCLDNINVKQEKKKQTKIKELQPQNIDFGDVEVGNPDSSMNLVRYYYKKVREHFGGDYKSNNAVKEAYVLSKLMKNWGDSADNTRKMFDFIIGKAKESNKFERVSTMSLYGYQRNQAHQAIFGQAASDANFAKPAADPEEAKMKNMKDLYDFYISTENLSHELAIEQLRSAFSASTFNRFLEGLHEKQIPVHQGTM